MKEYHLITGLPRSGSTLLSSILNQNPKFHANETDHLANMTSFVLNQDTPLFQRQNTLRHLFDGHYEHIKKPTIFNTNISWSFLTYSLKETFPKTKMLICVRNITDVLNSFELAYRRNHGASGDVYSRANDLMNGMVGHAYNGIKQAISGPDRDMFMFVDYDVLRANPEGMMKAIYNFTGHTYYTHDFKNVKMDWDELDKEVDCTTTSMVEYKINNMVLPPDLVNAYSNMEVWK